MKHIKLFEDFINEYGEAQDVSDKIGDWEQLTQGNEFANKVLQFIKDRGNKATPGQIEYIQLAISNKQ